MFKKFAFAAAAVVATAGAASANSYILELDETESRGTQVQLELVRAASNGTIEVYDFHRGEQGALLGSEMVNAGANTDVRVDLEKHTVNDVLAVLVVDGQVVDTVEIDID